MAQQGFDIDELLGQNDPGFETAPAPTAGSFDIDQLLGAGPGQNQPGVPVSPTRTNSLAAYPGAAPYGFGSALANGMTLGASDYARGLGMFAGNPGNGLMPAFDAARQQHDEWAARNPWANWGGEFAGSLGITGGILKASGLSDMMAAPGLLDRAAGAAVNGYVAGAINTPLTGGSVVDNAELGAGVSALFPFAGAAGRKMFLPKVDKEVLDAARDMAAAGGPKLRPSQIAMSEAMRKADEALAGKGNKQQLLDFTRAASRTFGADAERLTPEVMEKAETALQSRLDAVAASTDIDRSVAGSALDAKMAAITGATKGMPSSEAVREVVKQINAGFVSGKMTGKVYQSLTRFGGPIGHLAKIDPESGIALREALDDAMEASAGPGAREEWAEARSQYKNFLAVRSEQIKTPAHGILDPATFPNAIRKYFKTTYNKTEPDDLALLARNAKEMPRPDEFGGVKTRYKLPWWYQHGLGLAVTGGGAAELGLYHLDPKLAMAGGMMMGGMAAGRAVVGRAMKGEAPMKWVNNALMNPALNPPGKALKWQVPMAVGEEQRLRNKK